MNGNERLVILAVYLAMIVGVELATIIAFLNGTIDFDRFITQSVIIIGLVGALLVKLPPGKNEGDQTADTVNVEGEDINVTER